MFFENTLPAGSLFDVPGDIDRAQGKLGTEVAGGVSPICPAILGFKTAPPLPVPQEPSWRNEPGQQFNGAEGLLQATDNVTIPGSSVSIK